MHENLIIQNAADEGSKTQQNAAKRSKTQQHVAKRTQNAVKRRQHISK
jgi:hypothetical protein